MGDTDVAWLLSEVYPAGDVCFSFWIHMNGPGKAKGQQVKSQCYNIYLLSQLMDYPSRGAFHKTVRKVTHDFTNDLNMKN